MALCSSDSGRSFCSIAILTSEVQTYTYLACGPTATTEYFFAEATVSGETTAPSSSSVPSRDSSAPTSRIQTSPQPTPAPTAIDSTDSEDRNAPAIVGGAVGGFVFLCFAIIATILFRRCRRRRRRRRSFSGKEERAVSPAYELVTPESDAQKINTQQQRNPVELSG